ncbi:MAG: hypothetical protein KDC46_06655 [Thermoleophilia bacterium]|nr:hypothetical protein [Thermoleophilia bacterium]
MTTTATSTGSALPPAVLAQLQNIATTMVGGGGGAATPGAATPGAATTGTAANGDTSAYDAQINANQPIPGFLTATGTLNQLQAEGILSKGGALSFATVSFGGSQVQVVKSTTGYALVPGTGKDEIVQVDGRMLRFDGDGRNLNNFQVAERQGVPVEFDRRQGIAAGIGNLSRVVAARQERLKNLSEALAQDAQETGTTNQLDVQRLVMEQQVTENLSAMNKKIYDSVQQSVQAWFR